MKRSRIRSKSFGPRNLNLEEIIGLTIKNGNGISSSISTSKCSYIAGCVVVLYDVRSGTQSHLTATNRVPTPLSCVALSRDASIVAAGEVFQSGHKPGVLVWDCATLAVICELKCHPHGVACIALSCDGKHLVSGGFPRDGYICLWDWRNKFLAAKVKASSVSSPITSIDFSLDKKFIFTSEKNQLKLWKVGWPPGSCAVTRSVSVTLQRKDNLGHHPESSVVAVASPCCMSSASGNHNKASEQIPFYAVTNKGTLCMIYSGSPVINSVELEVEKCFALSATTSLVACACNNGLVKLFSTNSLKYAGGLSYAEAKRDKESNSVDCHTDGHQVEPLISATLPDAIACQFSTREKLVVVYDDHSLFVWNIHDIDKVTRCCVIVSHSGCIWDIINVPCENMHSPSLFCVAKGCSGGLSFATCSTDGNLRLWDLALQSPSPENSMSLQGDNSSNGGTCLVSAGIFERDSVAKDILCPEFRSMAVSSDGKYLAAGDCQGDIHIFHLCTSDYILIQEAHVAEILSLSFNVADMNDYAYTETSEGRHFLASGGRDGKIHLFDVDRSFNLVGSIDYHSCAVTIVKVSRSGCEILSCGADSSLVLHSVDVSDTECKISCLHKIATTGFTYDVVVDHTMDIAFTVGQDKKINAIDAQSGKLIRCFFQHDGEIWDPVKVITDGSCSYLACSYSNRCICVYDYITGEMVAQAMGHSDVITGLLFLPDCKRLVSVSADGCIFVWKLPSLLSSRMLQRTKQVLQFPPEIINQPLVFTEINPDLEVSNQQNSCSKDASVHNSGFVFSISRLPKWARYQVTDNNTLPVSIDSSSSKVNLLQDHERLESKGSSSSTQEAGQVSETLSRCSLETESSNIYPSPSKPYRWASNNRWLTIHTVCMDLLDSPKTCVMKKSLNYYVHGSAADIGCTSRGPPMERAHSNKRLKLSTLDSSIDNPTVQTNFQHIEDINSQDAPFEKYKDDASRKDSDGNEIFETNFGDFSSEPKTDRIKSSTKKSYRSRFVVRREILEGRKRSLCTFDLDSIGGSPGKTDKTSSCFLRMKPLEPSLEDTGNAAPSQVSVPPDADKASEVELSRLCKEALDNLEAAADHTLQSICKLTAEGKISDSEAAPLLAHSLPAIERKIQAVKFQISNGGVQVRSHA